MMVALGQTIAELRWHGRGGQGVVTASNLLAEAALLDGKYFQSLPEFGAERSGAPLVAYSRLSAKPIVVRGPVAEPHVVVVLDPTLVGRVDVVAGLSPEGFLLVNTPKPPLAVRAMLPGAPAGTYTLDATRIAMETLRRNIPNMPMLGALVRVTGIVSQEAVRKVITQRLGSRLGVQMMQANLVAFERGLQEVQGP
ncbi:MAG: 2-oxoacid:acceptor oxidoreductase family protein [Chloroflexi bacterium]|nr:2-oxoacid:acceptor oxidoreductase family protein [Chloroflexota bacterium]